jgi:hypothetical protein
MNHEWPRMHTREQNSYSCLVRVHSRFKQVRVYARSFLLTFGSTSESIRINIDVTA